MCICTNTPVDRSVTCMEDIIIVITLTAVAHIVVIVTVIIIIVFPECLVLSKSAAMLYLITYVVYRAFLY